MRYNSGALGCSAARIALHAGAITNQREVGALAAHLAFAALNARLAPVIRRGQSVSSEGYDTIFAAGVFAQCISTKLA